MMDRPTVMLLGVMVAAPAAASATETLQHPIGAARGEAHPVTPSGDYLVPDLPPAGPTRTDGGVSIRPSVVLLGDHTVFGQDGASLGQVGEQRSRLEMRAARLQLLGHAGRGFRIRSQIAGEPKGLDGDPETDRSLTDLNISLPPGRLTALAGGDPQARTVRHLGASFRSVASAGTLRYRGRPGSNMASGLFDTCIPRFPGWYLASSRVLTGETRPHDRSAGHARRISPEGHWGAPELVVRDADVDLHDNAVDGGRVPRRDPGVNRWASTRWKFGAALGHVRLDRVGQRGTTETLLTRIQWIS